MQDLGSKPTIGKKSDIGAKPDIGTEKITQSAPPTPLTDDIRPATVPFANHGDGSPRI
jgi:hypothetical protein